MTFHDEPADHRPASLPARYTLESLLARGGQGSVYTGTDTATGAPIAIKLMIAADLSAVERVHREVAAMRVLDVPGIVRILDNGHDSSRAWRMRSSTPASRTCPPPTSTSTSSASPSTCSPWTGR